MKNKFSIFVFYIFVILLWYLIAGLAGREIFPPPHRVIYVMLEGSIKGDLLLSSLLSLLRATFGFLVSGFLGLAVGMLLSQIRIFENLAESFLHTFQIVPNIVWVPVALVWFGASEWAIFFVLFIVGFLSVASYTLRAFRNVPKIFIDAARNMGEKGFGLYRNIKIPASVPTIIAGFKLAWIFVWRSLITAELIYASRGIGLVLNKAKDARNVEAMFAVILIIFLFGLLTEFLFGRLEHKISRRYGTT